MTDRKFTQLSAKQKRIAVVGDVIARLKLPAAKRYMVDTGTYLQTREFLDPEFVPKAKTQLQSFLPEVEQKCRVCGLGALFIGHVRLGNKVKLKQVLGCKLSAHDSLYGTLEVVQSVLCGYFSLKQLNSIEIAFEGWDPAGKVWTKAYPLPTVRLRAICRNILRNDGKFVIEEVRPPREHK